MSDLEIAIERLTSWIREYGDNKPKVFVGDVSIILLAAKESFARIAELEAADRMIANTCDLVARIEHLEAVLRKITKSIGNRVWMQQLAREGLETTT